MALSCRKMRAEPRTMSVGDREDMGILEIKCESLCQTNLNKMSKGTPRGKNIGHTPPGAFDF